MSSQPRHRASSWLAVTALPVALLTGGAPASVAAAPPALTAPTRQLAAVGMDGSHPSPSADVSSLFPSAGDDHGTSTQTHNRTPAPASPPLSGTASTSGHEGHQPAQPAQSEHGAGHSASPESAVSSDAASEHGGGHSSGPSPGNTDAGEGGHDGGHDSNEPPKDRPRGLVLGGFGVLNAAVLAFAAVMRRRGGADKRRRSRAARQRATTPTRNDESSRTPR